MRLIFNGVLSLRRLDPHMYSVDVLLLRSLDTNIWLAVIVEKVGIIYRPHRNETKPNYESKSS